MAVSTVLIGSVRDHVVYSNVLEYVGLGRLVVDFEFLPVAYLLGEASRGFISISMAHSGIISLPIHVLCSFRRKCLVRLAGEERFRRVGKKLKMYTYFHELVRFLNQTYEVFKICTNDYILLVVSVGLPLLVVIWFPESAGMFCAFHGATGGWQLNEGERGRQPCRDSYGAYT